MAEGRVTFSAMHTPSWDAFETVTLSASMSQVGLGGFVRIEADVPTEEARAYAAKIIAACEIVENDRG